jgi:tetratricopeptide (TPR) repeat protein
MENTDFKDFDDVTCGVNPGKTMEHAQAALQFLDNKAAPDPRDLEEVLDVLAINANLAEEHGIARDAYNKAVIVKKGLYGDESSQVATALKDSGDMLTRIGDFEQAESVLGAALALWRKQVSYMNCMLGDTLDEVSVCIRERGDFAEARKYAEQATEALERSGIEKSSLIPALQNLGIILRALGEEDKAAKVEARVRELNEAFKAAHPGPKD